jgi:hypothetical protein
MHRRPGCELVDELPRLESTALDGELVQTIVAIQLAGRDIDRDCDLLAGNEAAPLDART